jgi:LacI family transcriptional regulator
MAKQPPTLKDVAKNARVSVTTASYVINGRTGGNIRISDETRERVWRAVEELDYRPNIAARNMRTGRSNLIGFITDEIGITPFGGDIIKGAQTAAWQHKRLLFVVSTGNDPDIEERAISMLLERRVEGIIYATEYHRPVNPPENILEVPTVLLDCYVEDGSLSSVVPDEIRGGYEATETLLKQGHRRIGFVNCIKPMPATFGRLEGYKQALTEYGIPFDEILVHADEGNAAGGYRCALNLLEQADRPTALFCWSDWMAMGAYDAIRKLGLRIPEDVAVVGFDDMVVIAAQLHPSLTTMRLPYYEMGEWAVCRLIEQLDEKSDIQPVQSLMHCPLINRQSV